MAIRPFLSGFVFDEETVTAMGVAFDRARHSIGLIDKEDAVTKLVAQKIIEAAQAGERDPNRLYETVREWAMQRAATDWPEAVIPIRMPRGSR